MADIAKELGVLTVGVVTKPFRFEGMRRMKQAEGGIAELRNKVDSLVIIPNERLKLATDQKITMVNAFEIADDVLQQAVQSISDLIKNTDVYKRQSRGCVIPWTSGRLWASGSRAGSDKKGLEIFRSV